MKNIIKTVCLMLILMTTSLFGADGGFVGYLQDSWKAMAGVIALLIGSFWIPGVREIMIIGVRVLIGPKMRKLIFIKVAEKWVDSTENDLDNDWLDGVKEEMKKKKL